MAMPHQGVSTPATHNPSGVAAAQPDQVVQYLLAHNYLLTALELLVEAQEAGDEDDVKGLQLFFSDQAKFPAEAVARFDPSEAINIQQLARKREERLGVLEYELRVAKEDLAETHRGGTANIVASSLVSEPVEAAATVSNLTEEASTPAATAAAESSAAQDSLSVRDRATMNGAVRAYLVSQGYKLTALTLSEEGGSSIPAKLPFNAPTLTDMFQGNNLKLVAAEAREASQAMQQEAETQAAAANARAAALQDALDAMTKEKARLRADLEYLQSQLDMVTQQAEAAANKTSQVPEDNEQHKLSNGDGSGPRLLGAEAALTVVAEQLPKIVPNMLINKRDDVLPILLAVIQEHRNAAIRDTLTHALFNLVKKPNSAQRRLIADSCADLAGRIGQSRTAEELLPQCWEQVNHRHAERRALVAEACGALAPHVASEMRASLILSILQQMATDTDAAVRRAMAQALTSLLPLLPNLDKFQAVQSMLLQLAKDPSQDVVDTALEHLLPALLKCMADTDLLHTSLLPAILTDIRASIERCPFLAGTPEAVLQSEQAELRAVNDHQQRQVQMLLRLYTSLLPGLRQAALQSSPSWAGSAEVKDALGSGMARDALAATIKREAAAVLNVGRVFHSEDEEIALPTHAPPSLQPSIPDSPCSSSALDTSTRLSTAHSMPDDDEDIQGSQAAPAGTASSLTEGNVDHMSALAPGKPPPSPSGTSHPGDRSATSQQHQHQQQGTHSPLPKGSDITPPAQQPVDDHPLQAHSPSPRTASAQQGVGLEAPAGEDAHGEGQSLGTPAHSGAGGQSGAAGFGAWASAAEGHGDWEAVEWLARQALPALLASLRMVAPHTETEALRRRFSAAIKATCLSFGQSFTADVIQPLFLASAAAPEQHATSSTAEHLDKLLVKQRCVSAEAKRVGRLTVLPLLLSAVLPYAQPDGKALEAFLHAIVQQGMQDDESTMWAVKHIQDVSAAVRFACAFQEVQAPVSHVMKALQAHDNAAVRRCAVAHAAALTPSLPRHQVMQQVLPTLQRLSEDHDSTVQVAAIDGLAQLLPLHGSNPEMAGRLYSHFDELVTSNQPQIQLAVLQSLTAHVAQFGDAAMEFLLQKVLMVLTYVHRRGPGSVPEQLHSLANACFIALRAADTCEVQNETVQLHLMAALQSLSREGELLPANQREVLSAMLREHGVTATPHASDAALQHHRRSSTACPDSLGSTAHLGASSQTPPGVPRQSANMTRRPSDLGPSISGGQSTPSKGNLGAALLRRFNSGTPAEQPRRGIFRAGSGTGPHDHAQRPASGDQR